MGNWVLSPYKLQHVETIFFIVNLKSCVLMCKSFMQADLLHECCISEYLSIRAIQKFKGKVSDTSNDDFAVVFATVYRKIATFCYS